MLNITVDKDRISKTLKASVTVTSDENFTAVEARATKNGSAYGRGVGLCLLSDDATTSDGVVTFASALKSYSFDVESAELETDGDYRISVYVMNEDGIWNDTYQLYTNASEAVIDSNGKYVLAKRNGTGTDTSYTSSYSGEEIDDFITEVLL